MDEIKFRDVSGFLRKNKRILIYISLILIILLSVYIRTRNISGLIDITTNKPTLAPDLDPYLFLRRARTIIQEGSLPEIDNMRYVAAKLSPKFNLNSYAIVGLYYFMSIFKDIEIETAAIWLPVLATALSLIPLFFLVKLIFSFKKKEPGEKEDFRENKTTASTIALLSVLLLIVVPAYLHRTIAGVPELEALGMLFFFSAFLAFLYAWKKSDLKGRSYLVYSLIAGLATGLMWVTWGGDKFVFMIIAVSVLAAYLFANTNTRKFYVYSIWLFSALALRWALKGVWNLTTFYYAIAFFTFGVLLIDQIIKRSFLKEKIERTRLRKIPYRLRILMIIIILFIAGVAVFNGPGFVLEKLDAIKTSALHPFGLGRIGLTVAENKQPFYSSWVSNFGPEIKKIPMMFWLFFLGSVALFYEFMKNLAKKKRILMTLAYAYFIFSLIFSRYSNDSVLNGSSVVSNLFYVSGFIVLGLGFLYIYFKNKGVFGGINFAHLFLLVWFFWTIIGARGAMRLFFLIVPAASILASFFVIWIVQYVKRSEKGSVKKFVLLLASVLSVLFLILIIMPTPGFIQKATGVTSYTQQTLAASKMMVPGAYHFQWQKAMAWVRENTPEDSVFGHWWDYGYWVQYLGERATDTDGGHQITWWDHLNGRYALTADNEKTALQYLKTHEVTHFLIDPSDVGKYSAFSSIASDSEEDRRSFIPTFTMDESMTNEEKDKTTYIYPLGVTFDGDVEYVDEKTGNRILFPKNSEKAVIGGFVLTMDKSGNYEMPMMVILSGSQRYLVPMRYLYIDDELIDYGGNSIKGALYIIPQLIQEGDQIRINKIGGALYLSEKIMRSQFARLYLLNQTDSFELIHKESDIILDQFRQRGLNVGDFVIFHGFRGPIKIWKINYSGDVETHEEYLQDFRGTYGELDYFGT